MQRYYRFLHSNKNVRKNSSSGGAFTLISDLVLDQGGIVYGCMMDENQNVRHIRATNKDTRDTMRGSKYVQSDIRDIFLQVKGDLGAGYWVLFTGTPCQCYAINQYLQAVKVNTKNLVLLEIICHGVGSRKFFEDYVKHLERKYKGKAISVNFRAKHRKGQKQDMSIQFDNGKTFHASSTKFDWFYSVYLRNLILRPSCYECPFTRKERFADLSIADHWGYRNDEAYSLIISNTDLGNHVLRFITTEKIEEITESEVKQPHLKYPCGRPKSRESFWEIYQNQGYLAVQKWLENNTVRGMTKDFLARFAYRIHIAGLLKCFYRSRGG